MTAFLNLANWLLPLVYLAFLIDYGVCFFLRANVARRNLWLWPALGFHGLFLALLVMHLHRPLPANNYEVLTLVAFAIAAVYALAESATHDRRTGVFVFAAVFFLQYTSSMFLPRHMAAATLPGWTRLHMIPAVFAYTAFTLAAIYGLLHMLATRNLKRQSFGLLFDRLPSLEMLGKMMWNALVAGFVCITLAIATGAIVYGQAGAAPGGPMTAKVIAKIVAGSAAWLFSGSAIFGRWLGKWSDKQISHIAIFGFLAVAALLVASLLLT
jgi:ABC-type uncharacterized transport system permease subunit